MERPPGMLKRLGKHPKAIVPAVMLFFLAPVFGEYLLGNLKFSEFFYIPFIAPLYGAGALLIREMARRTGRGFGTMLTLGVAYGLHEEGLVDQMLFNRSYFEGQEHIMDTYMASLGLDAWLTILVLAMHAIWSSCIPIALVEALFSDRGNKPWLGRKGLTVTLAIFLIGSAYLTYVIAMEENFFASIHQLSGTAAVITFVVTAAFTIGRRRSAPAPDSPPTPWVAGLFALIASSLFMLTEMLPGWTKVGACLLLLLVFFTVIFRWSRRIGWVPMHRLAVAGGGMLTYIWLGLFMEPETGPKTLLDHIGSLFFAGGAIALLAVSAWKLRKRGTSSRLTNPS